MLLCLKQATPPCFLLTFWNSGGGHLAYPPASSNCKPLPLCGFATIQPSHVCLLLSICSGMKRPLSPSPSGEKEPPTTAAPECPPHSPESSKPKRERKRPSYTLCDVCNIQLNSAAQAQVHCGGRAHQRRLRQLSLGKTSTGPGQCRVALNLAPFLKTGSGSLKGDWVFGFPDTVGFYLPSWGCSPAAWYLPGMCSEFSTAKPKKVLFCFWTAFYGISWDRRVFRAPLEVPSFLGALPVGGVCD